MAEFGFREKKEEAIKQERIGQKLTQLPKGAGVTPATKILLMTTKSRKDNLVESRRED